MISKDLLYEMNAAYLRLEKKCAGLITALKQQDFQAEAGWYNGHYQKNAEGGWSRDAYPIPVIGVKGLCDIEIQFDRISVSAKRNREEALTDSYGKLMGYEFEAYGVEDFLSDYCHPGMTVEDLQENIRSSDEREIGFSFYFPFEAEEKQISEFVMLLRQEGFYY